MLFAIGAGAMAVCAVLFLARLLMGPTHYDRMLAANGAALCAVLAMGALGAGAGRAEWTDAALALLLAQVVGNATVMKFFVFRTFQAHAPVKQGEAESVS